jgi:hypothetical protein
MRSLLSTALVVFASLANAQNISTPAQLIAAMHDRYASKWYHTLTFEQQSITHKADGTESTELWQEALLLPGRLRIVIGEPSAGNGMLFVNNHLFVFRDGKLATERDYVHPLLVLGFDVYTQPPADTLRQLQDLHVDLSTMHEEAFNGRSTYVVGAPQGDLKTLQFWIDKSTFILSAYWNRAKNNQPRYRIFASTTTSLRKVEVGSQSTWRSGSRGKWFLKSGTAM